MATSIFDRDYKTATIEDVINTLEQVTPLVREDFGELSEAQLNWKPTPDRWSVGECLEHLITANGRYFKLAERALSEDHKPPFMRLIPGWARMGGGMLIGAVSPQTARKVKTLAIFEPAVSTVPADEVARFESHQAELLEWIRKSRRLDLDKTIVASPATAILVYSLMDAWRVLAAHEVRHLLQARRVVETEAFPR